MSEGLLSDTDWLDDERAADALELLAESACPRDEALSAAQLPALHARIMRGSASDVRAPRLLDRLARLQRRLRLREQSRCLTERASIARGRLRGSELAQWLAAHPKAARDWAIEQLLGISHCPLSPAVLPEDHMPYVASSVSGIFRALLEVPVDADDVLVDLGSGLGKAVMLANLLTGAAARGVELQEPLAVFARERAAALGLDRVSFDAGDAREAPLDFGTVFFLYLPFTGRVLQRVLERLREQAARRAIVVCTLGVHLDRCDWLVERPSDSLWLSIHDSAIAGVAPRRRARPANLGPRAIEIVEER